MYNPETNLFLSGLSTSRKEASGRLAALKKRDPKYRGFKVSKVTLKLEW